MDKIKNAYFQNKLQIQDKIDGDLPLHVAMKWGSSETIVQFLLEEYQEGALIKDGSNDYPLHLAIRQRYADSIVKYILDMVKEKHDYSQLLHLAIFHERSLELMKTLLEAYPNSIKSRNSIVLCITNQNQT